VIGARVRRPHTIFMRGLGNKFLNILASYLSGVKIEDLTSGFRAVKREAIARFINLLPNGYSPSATSTLAFFEEGYAVKYIPITTYRRAGGKSQVRLLRDGAKFMAIIMRMIILFEPLKVFIPVSIILFLIGLFRFFHSLLKYRIASDIAILLMTIGVFIFFFGFLADQIAILRREIK